MSRYLSILESLCVVEKDIDIYWRWPM